MEYYKQLDDDLTLRKETELIKEEAKRLVNDSTAFSIWVDIEHKNDKIAAAYCHVVRSTMKKGDYECNLGALKRANQAIANAVPESAVYAEAVWSRTTILFDMKQFIDCIDDCDFGISLKNASKYFKAQFKYRKLECYLEMKDKKLFEEAQRTLKYFKKLKLEPDEKDVFTRKVNMLVTLGKTVQLENDAHKRFIYSDAKPTEEDLRLKIRNFAPNAKAPHLSKKVELCLSEQGEPFVKAIADINFGEFIMIDKAFDGYLVPHQRFLFCGNCNRCYWRLLPCDNCTQVVYCSVECKDENYRRIHKYECNVFPIAWASCQYQAEKDNSWNVHEFYLLWYIRLAMVAILKAGGIDQFRREAAQAQKLKESPRHQKQFINTIYCSANAISVLSSLQVSIDPTRDEEVKLAENARSIACQAVFYLAIRTEFFGKKFVPNFSKIMKDKDVIYMAALILRISLTVSFMDLYCNLAYRKHCPRRNPWAKVEEIAFVLHPSCKFRHSCDPDIEYLTNDEGDMIMWAVKNIKKNSEILLSYSGQKYQYYSKQDREKALREHVRILECPCTACVQNWPTWNDLPISELLKDQPLELKMSLFNHKAAIINYDFKCSLCVKYDPLLHHLLNEFIQALVSNDLCQSDEYRNTVGTYRNMYMTTLGRRYLPKIQECTGSAAVLA